MGERERRWPGKRRRPKEKGNATRGSRRLQAQGDREREVTEGDKLGRPLWAPYGLRGKGLALGNRSRISEPGGGGIRVTADN